MQITIYRDLGTFSLQPNSETSGQTLREMLATGVRQFRYGGFRGEKGQPGGKIIVRHEETEFEIEAGSKEQALDLDAIRCCLFRTGSMLVVSSKDGPAPSIMATTGYCTQCEKPLVTWWETETCFCDGCSDKCEHVYERQVSISRTGRLGYKPICTICNRGPKAEDADDLEQTPEETRKALKGMGITVVGPVEGE